MPASGRREEGGDSAEGIAHPRSLNVKEVVVLYEGVH